jgi:hypothetical protein
MSRFGRISLILAVSLSAAAVAPAAQASEVVKLARLVITGKRTTTEPTRATEARQPSTDAPTHAAAAAPEDTAPNAPAPRGTFIGVTGPGG